MFAPCLADADAGLNLRQRPEGRAFEFLASWGLAKELLQLIMAQIKVFELEHALGKAAAVLVQPAGPSEALWPVEVLRPPAAARHLASPAAAMLDMLENDGDAPRLARPRQAAFAGMAAERTVPCDPQSPWPDPRVEAEYSPSSVAEEDWPATPERDIVFAEAQSAACNNGTRAASTTAASSSAPPPGASANVAPAAADNSAAVLAQPAADNAAAVLVQASCEGGAAEGAPRQARGGGWGPFAVAPVFRNGVHVAWGATCGRHHNARDRAACSRQLAKGLLSDAECRARLKRWLLLGLDIPAGELSRTRHMEACSLRRLDPGGDEAQLDSELATRAM